VAVAAAVAMVAMAGMSAAGQVMQGQNQAKADLNQGRELSQQASEEKQAAGQEIANEDYKATQTLGRVSANAGAAGVTQEGSVATVKMNSEAEQTTNDMYTKYSGNLAALKDAYAARTLKYEGDQLKVSSAVGAGMTLTQGIINAYGTYKSFNTRGASPGGPTTTNPSGGSLFNSN
jgi:hypothetical protein